MAPLNAKARRFVAAVLTETTIMGAARSAGLSKSTAWRLMRDPAVKAELDAQINALVDGIRGRLAAGADRAVDTLDDLMRSSEVDAVRARSAVSWLSWLMQQQSRLALDVRLDPGAISRMTDDQLASLADGRSHPDRCAG